MEPGAVSLPRILCLHGGGTSADIFQIQCRAIIKHLASTFRLVFIDAPFQSKPHPDIVSYFGKHGPFYRWLRWSEEDPYEQNAEAILLSHVRQAMDNDSGTGDWVGVLGFSQGAKIAASLLWAQERVPSQEGPFKFGVIMAGRAPVVVLDPEGKLSAIPYTGNMTQRSDEFKDWAPNDDGPHALSTPTLHVHGLQDAGTDLHRLLLEDYCKAGSTRLVEWDGGHRLPIRPDDVQRLVSEMLAMAREVGAIQ